MTFAFGENEHHLSALQHPEDALESTGIAGRIQLGGWRFLFLIARPSEGNHADEAEQPCRKAVLEECCLGGDRQAPGHEPHSDKAVDECVVVTCSEKNWSCRRDTLSSFDTDARIEPVEGNSRDPSHQPVDHAELAGVVAGFRVVIGDYKLLLMKLSRVPGVASALVVFVVLSCSDESGKAPVDSSAASAPQPVAPPVTANTGWDEAAGPALILSTAADPGGVSLVLPQLTDSSLANSADVDVSALVNSRVELFGSHGLSGEATLMSASLGTGVDGCRAWPQARLSGIPPKPWRVGFINGRVTGTALDSIEGISAADSAAFTAEIIRIASSYSQAGDSAYRGLPFSVRKAYRFSVGSTPVFVANVVRKINAEANPRQEHSLVIAERSGGTYRAAFQTRTAGSEESVQTNDILAVVNIVETGQPAIIVTFEHEDGGRVGLVERASGGRWRVVWRSAYTGC